MYNIGRLRSIVTIVFALLLVAEGAGVFCAFILSGNIAIGIITAAVALICALPSLILYKIYMDVFAEMAEAVYNTGKNIEIIEKQLGALKKQLDDIGNGRNDYKNDMDPIIDQTEKKKRISALIKERNEFVNMYKSGTLKEEDKAKTIEYIRQIEAEIKAIDASMRH